MQDYEKESQEESAVRVLSQKYLKETSVELVSSQAGVCVYRARFAFEEGYFGGDIRLELDFPMLGLLSVFSPVLRRDRGLHQWFHVTRVRSDFYYNTPLLSAVKDGNTNYATVALSDSVNSAELALCVEDFEEQEKIRFHIRLLTGREKRNVYEVYLRVDTRPIAIQKALAQVGEWFYNFYPKRGEAPKESEYPLYSSWYNFHQHPNAETLEKELALAAKIGLKSLIIDDGWQYDGLGTADYIDCGDWAVSKEKFPDFKGFIDYAHRLGIKVSLWFPVPFVGFHTKAYAKFRDKLLYEEGATTNAGILDLRYQEVREHIVQFLVRFVKEYGLDGLKLDFIDSFVIREDTPAQNEKMDIPSLGEAVIALLEELDERLKEVNPALLIEYRQDYVGPAITRYCNMLRVADCAFDVTTNRTGIADLRMLDYPLAVHSDMLYWAKSEGEENVARQLLNVLFSVPQISVLLTEIPQSHVELVKAFLEYWTENSKILLHGEMLVKDVDCNYSVLTARGENKSISAVYTGNSCKAFAERQDIFNATQENLLVIVNESGSPYTGKCFDAYHKEIDVRRIEEGATFVNLPVGGYIRLYK